jgi:hypothetical protein
VRRWLVTRLCGKAILFDVWSQQKLRLQRTFRDVLMTHTSHHGPKTIHIFRNPAWRPAEPRCSFPHNIHACFPRREFQEIGLTRGDKLCSQTRAS